MKNLNINLIKHKILKFINVYPLIYFPVQIIRKKHKRLLVNKKTDIVIEGYVRSSNSFAVYAFSLAQGSIDNPNLHIAHHLHAPAQIKRAVKFKIPIIILVRHPKDAILSAVIKIPFMTLNQAMKDYIRFYSNIIMFKKKFVVATFEEVTSDFGKIIENVNEFFNRRYVLFKHNKENVKKCFRIMEDRGKYLYNNDPTKYSIPSKQKQERKLS